MDAVAPADAAAAAVRPAGAWTDLDGYVVGKAMLNAKEQALYKSNTFKALQCIVNGKLALDYSKSNYYDSVLIDGNGDAFRHALWNFGMAIDVGQSFAKTWSDAHEYGTPNNPPSSQQMDLFNNKVGLDLARVNPSTFWHSTFISLTKAKVRAGACKVIKAGRLVASDKAGEK